MGVQPGGLVPETPYIWRARRPGGCHRLICFPHAGGGAVGYAEWVRWLPPEAELVAVQLPGRQNRIAEEPFAEVGPMVNVLAHALRPVLEPPFAFFGHSGGAILAYEMARALRTLGRGGPAQLFLSGQPAPGTGSFRPLHDLPDEEFRAELLRLGGVQPEIAADEDVMTALLPTLRADFGLWERHRSVRDTPLDCPIIVLGGETDPRAPADSVRGWREHTTAGFAARFFAGGHFYFIESAAEVVSFIGTTMLASTMHRGIT
jgi:medium-chain acyl-[acyl-carrier-protein] hydrolase